MDGQGTLNKRRQYVLVYRQGQTWMNNFLVMKILPNNLNLSRYGISVTKKVGKAVKRNRLKRLLREIMRLRLIKPGWDIVFIPRGVAVTVGYHQLADSVTKLLAQAGLLKDETINS